MEDERAYLDVLGNLDAPHLHTIEFYFYKVGVG